MHSSILCAAAWTGWRKEISRWAIVLGDQPHLKPDTLQTFLEFAAQHPQAICQPQFGQRTAHPVILPKSLFSTLPQSLATNLKEFLAQTTTPRATFPFNDEGLTLDLDTPEDYQRLHPRD
jgi:CTP:molybdopterin cytidylyltransferase MocA